MEKVIISKVKLHGVWASPYCNRVEMALKLKGIHYQYIEEDLLNKTQTLLSYNPVHKKVPLLLHDQRPIAESLIILEYIDETWNHRSPLLPLHPYQRAKARFWADFIQHQLFPSVCEVNLRVDEEQRKAVEKLYDNLEVAEECIGKDFFTINGEPEFTTGTTTPGYLDIVAASALCTYRAFEESSGIKIMDPERNPLILSWVRGLSKVAEVKECLPPHEKFAARLKNFRDKVIQSLHG